MDNERWDYIQHKFPEQVKILFYHFHSYASLCFWHKLLFFENNRVDYNQSTGPDIPDIISNNQVIEYIIVEDELGYPTIRRKLEYKAHPPPPSCSQCVWFKQWNFIGNRAQIFCFLDPFPPPSSSDKLDVLYGWPLI